MSKSDQNSISALVVCRNEERNIEACLRSLGFCDEIIVVDDFSDDRTPELARPLCSAFFQRSFIGCNDQKDFARLQASCRWVLNLDADERIAPELRAEILAATAEPGGLSGFTIPVRTYIGKRWIKHGGYWPNRKRRLFLRESGTWDKSHEPHDRVAINGCWGALKQPVEHFHAANTAEMRAKILRRAELAAAKMSMERQSISRIEARLRGEWRHLRSYIFKRGFLEGRLGLELAELERLECLGKYRLLREINKR